MFITFEETYLQDLYEKGKTGDKKHRYQPDIVRRYQKCIQLMKKVPDIESLAKYNSLNYEVLKGDKNGISSRRSFITITLLPQKKLANKSCIYIDIESPR